MSHETGPTLSHYRLMDPLGRGGMGVVYRARDTKLGRDVALKILTPDPARKAARVSFLRHEARTAATLNHANICTIHEIGEVASEEEAAALQVAVGTPFLVMELVEGQALGERIAESGLPLDELLDVAGQLAEGLREAHAHGIVHRDLKPGNVMVTPNGLVKILDFGLAVPSRVGATAPEVDRDADTVSVRDLPAGGIAGTIEYMSPEQVLGQEVDTRSDLFSFGTLLYEMASGRRPFQGESTVATVAKILEADPGVPSNTRPELPSDLDEIVRRCLGKNPADRYPSTDDLVAALAKLRTGGGGSIAVSRNTVAVFPFPVRGGGEYAYLGEGLVDLLSTKLDGTGELHSVDPHRVLCCRPDEPAVDPEEAARSARDLGAGLFVMGNLLEAGGRLHIDAALYDSTDGRHLAKAAAQGSAAEIFELVDRLTVDLVAGRCGGPESRLTRIAAATTESFAALKAYLEGEREMRAMRRADAVAAYQRAVAEDGEFGLAWYRLGVAALWSRQPQLAWQAAEKALEHGARLTDRDRTLLEAFHALLRGAHTEAERLYRDIVEVHPEDIEAWYQLGEILFHHRPLQGGPVRESRAVWERLLALDERHVPAMVHLGVIEAAERNLPALEEWTRRALEHSPTGDSVLWMEALRAFAGSDADARARVLADLREASDHSLTWAVRLVGAYLRDLSGAEAMARLLTEPVRSAEARALGHVLVAHLHLARGRWGACAAELAAAASRHPDTALEYGALLAASPFLDPSSSQLDEMRAKLKAWSPTSGSPPPGPSPWVRPHEGFHEPLRLYFGGLLAARLQDVEALRHHADGLATSPVPGSLASLVDDLARGLRARALWIEGSREEAVESMQGARMETSLYFSMWSPVYSQAHERFCRAEWLYELGRSEEAMQWYGSFAENSIFDLIYLAPSHLRRASILERLGRGADAAVELKAFLELWGESEAPLRGQVEEAAVRLVRLDP